MRYTVTFYDQIGGEYFVIELPSYSKAQTVANGLWFARTGERTRFDRKELNPSITSPDGFCVSIFDRTS